MTSLNFEHKCKIKKAKSVLILGKGLSANAVFDYIKKDNGQRFSSVTIVEEDELDDLKRFDLCVSSPGISQFSDFFKRAQAISKEVISEVEFAYRESEKGSLWIAISGTNGKTTTTALTEHILKTAGANAVAVGNIGKTCISQVDGAKKIYVCECSSYQLACVCELCPDACAILNITPDHLKWHEGFENYKKAKFNIFSNSKNKENALVYLDREILDEAKKSYPISDFSCELETDLTSNSSQLVNSLKDKMLIKGEHNVLNAICATTLAKFILQNRDVPKCSFLCDKTSQLNNLIEEALLSFSPLEHRIEPVGVFGGISFFNDSKATNVDSTIKALSAFKQGRVVLLLGGKDKLSSLSPLVKEIVKPFIEASGPRVKCAICYGEASERFIRDLQPIKDFGILLEQADHLTDAFELATNVAVQGDNVLLSPACASFDEFSSFEERGEFFKNLVENYKKCLENS